MDRMAAAGTTYSNPTAQGATMANAYLVSIPIAPYERRVATLADAARLLGSAAQSRNVSRILMTAHGAYAGLAPLTEADRIELCYLAGGRA